MRELDVLLTRYFDDQYPTATMAMRSAFEDLLTRPDPEILALITSLQSAEDPRLREIVERIRGSSGVASG
jgi:succinate dehydrogenase flavin-adding protein (antitoxin of CptAB toxin-antitoxin module)